MSKRRFVWIGIGVVLAALAVWLVVGVSRTPPEPLYEGKALSVWLDKKYRFAQSTAEREKGKEAVLSIGTNAIPTLLRMIRAKDPQPAILKLLEFASIRRWVNYRYAWSSHELAGYGFEILGTNAVSAVPALIRICADARNPASQEYSAAALGNIGPLAKAALPVLLKHFSHTNSEVRFRAVTAVLHIGGDAGVIVPAMKSVLNDSNPSVRFNAVAALRDYVRGDAYSRSNALTAVPELMEALHEYAVPPGRILKDELESALKDELESALWELVPEKIAKPLVVEDSTPMVTNGVTTETLYRHEYGDLWALIPKGRTVRCTVYQSIANNPVYLYRGSNHFLGRFQVAEPATNTAVEIVYIVDDQQIRLCARDYGRKEFPALRRVQEDAEK